MAQRIFDLNKFFDGDAYETEKNKFLASRISIAAYEAGLDVEAQMVGEKIRVIITAEEITEDHLYKLGTLIEEEFKKISHEYVTKH